MNEINQVAPLDLEKEGAFKEYAINVYRQWQQRNAQLEKEAHIEATRESRKAFIKTFGIDPDSTDGRLVYIDGIKLRYIAPSYSYDYGNYSGCWHVVAPCPNCFEEVRSPSCYNLEDIGHYVAEFKPDYDHYCNKANTQSSDNSPEERLLSAIKDLIYQSLPSE